MWFQRRRRQLPLDLSSLERSLDRLAELVERFIALIPEVAAPHRGDPIPPTGEPAAEPASEHASDEHVLFAGGPHGYRLQERAGAAPPRGSLVELDGERYVVLRLGLSPLPNDRRRCAFLERD